MHAYQKRVVLGQKSERTREVRRREENWTPHVNVGGHSGYSMSNRAAWA